MAKRSAPFQARRLAPPALAPSGCGSSSALPHCRADEDRYLPLPWCRADVDLLAVAVPGVDPAAVAGCEGVARHANHVACGTGAHCMIFPSLRVIKIDPAAISAYHKGRTVALHFSHAGGGECLVFVTRFVVEIYPSATGFDRRNSVRVVISGFRLTPIGVYP